MVTNNKNNVIADINDIIVKTHTICQHVMIEDLPVLIGLFTAAVAVSARPTVNVCPASTGVVTAAEMNT